MILVQPINSAPRLSSSRSARNRSRRRGRGRWARGRRGNTLPAEQGEGDVADLHGRLRIPVLRYYRAMRRVWRPIKRRLTGAAFTLVGAALAPAFAGQAAVDLDLRPGP